MVVENQEKAGPDCCGHRWAAALCCGKTSSSRKRTRPAFNHQIRSAGCLAVTNTSRHRNARSRGRGRKPNPAPAAGTIDQNGQRTYEMAASDNVEPVAPGESPDHFACAEFGIDVAGSGDRSTHGAELERQAGNKRRRDFRQEHWRARSLDHKNQVATFTFVGINLKPGANKIRCTAISPDGAPVSRQKLW